LVSGPRATTTRRLRSDQPFENQIGPVQHLKGMRGLWVARPTVRLAEATEVSKPSYREMGRGISGPTSGPAGPRATRGRWGARHVEDAEGVGGAEVDLDVAATVVMASTEISGEPRASRMRGRRRCRIGVDENGSGQLTPRRRVRIIRRSFHRTKEDRMNILITYCGE